MISIIRPRCSSRSISYVSKARAYLRLRPSVEACRFSHSHYTWHTPVVQILEERRLRGMQSSLRPPKATKFRALSAMAPSMAVQRGRYLPKLFHPASIAVFGTTGSPEDVAGSQLLKNLTEGRGAASRREPRRIYVVNDSVMAIDDVESFASLEMVPEAPDIAVILSPAAEVPAIIRSCVRKEVKIAVVMSKGFRECGERGRLLEEELLEISRNTITRILGPNSSGVMVPSEGLNITSFPCLSSPGRVGFLFEGSGGSSLVDWSQNQKLGVSAYVSVGNKCDINWGDIIGLFRDDPNTKALCLFIESVGQNARSFISSARELALRKPIIALHAGKTKEGALVSARDSGAPASDVKVLEAALLRCGILRVGTLSTLYKAAMTLSLQPIPKGPHLSIISNSNAASVLATDGLIYNGGQLASFSEETRDELQRLLPPHSSPDNPISAGHAATPEHYQKIIETVLKDRQTSGAMIIHTPEPGLSPHTVAETITSVRKPPGKILMACFMGGNDEVEDAKRLCIEKGVPTFRFPDTAARVFDIVQQYSFSRDRLYETPVYPKKTMEVIEERKRVEALINAARAENRHYLTQSETSLLLNLCGIELLPYELAKTEDSAVALAERLGFPIVMKRLTRVGRRDAVLGLTDEESVRRAFCLLQSTDGRGRPPSEEGKKREQFAGVKIQKMVYAGYELRLSSRVHHAFGPIIEFGAGTRLGGEFQDDAVGLPPLTSTLARRMMEKTRIYKALRATSYTLPSLSSDSKAAAKREQGLETLECAMVLFSEMVADFRYVKAVTVNPLLIIPDEYDRLTRLVALDASVSLYDRETGEDELVPTAILPYPQHLVRRVFLRDKEFTVRPVRPEDEERLREFHQDLSEDTVRLRYFQNFRLSQRVSHERLSRSCFIDYSQEMALLVLEKGTRRVLGVGKLFKHSEAVSDIPTAEYAILVHDSAQQQGIGSLLMEQLIEVGARDWGLRKIVADVLPTNAGMKALCKKFGFSSHYDQEEGVLKMELSLSPS